MLVVWVLLLTSFTVVYAETGQARNIRAYSQNTGFYGACETRTGQVWSISSLPSSDIPLPEDRREDRLQLMGLQPDAYAASLENSKGSTLIEDVPSLPEKPSPLTTGMTGNSEATLLRADRLSPLDETMTGRMSPLSGAGAITNERSIFAGGDTLMAIAPDPSEDRPCEKSDIPVDGDQVTGGVPGKDWSGIGRDTAYFAGYQFLIVGLLYVLPESVNGWSQEQKEEYSLERWKENVSNPQWDHDKWYVNYLFHPYWGATYYIRARERGFDKLESFIYSTALSVVYEFGVEALFEQPSYQDLIITSTVGTLLGMYVFEPIRETIKAKGEEQKWYDKMALILSDPLGAVSGLTDKVLGVKSSARVIQPASNKQRCRPVDGDALGLDRTANTASCRTSFTGLELTFQW